MTDRVRVGLRVPREDVELYEEAILEKYGQKRPYAGVRLEDEIRTLLEIDTTSKIEKQVDRLVRAAGRRPEDCSTKKQTPTRSVPAEGDTKLVNYRIHPDVRESFMTWVDNSCSSGAGRMLGVVMRTYAHGGSLERTLDKLLRVTEDAEALLATANEDTDSGLRKNGREVKTVAVCNELGEQFTDEELGETIREVAGVSSAPSVRQYRGDVVERLNVEPHPENPDLWVPQGVVDDLLGGGVPRECRMPVEYLDREQREQRVMLELGRRAIPRGGNDSVSASDVRTDLLDDIPARSTVADIIDAVAATDGFTAHESGDTTRLRVDLGTTNSYRPELMARIRGYYDEESARDTSLASYDETDGREHETEDIAAEWDTLDSATPNTSFATDGGPDDTE